MNKNTRPSAPLSTSVALAVAAALSFASSAHAANTTFTLTPTTNVWSTDTWSNPINTIAAGDIAQYNGGGTATTSLDTVGVTLGQLQTGTTAASTWNITAGGGSFVLDGTGISAGNQVFGNAGVAAIASRSAGGNLTVASNISIGATALDIGATNTGIVTINGNITATAAQTITFRGGNTGVVTIGGTIGASGSNIALVNRRSGGGNVVINGALGTSVSSVTQGGLGDSAGSAMILAGTNTYTGATTVTQGTLRFLSDTGSSASSAVSVGGAGTTNVAKVHFDHTGQTTGGTTTRAASLTYNGGQGTGNGFSQLQLTGVNTSGVNTVDRVTGALTLNSGAFVYMSTAALANVNQELRVGSFVRNAGSVFTGRSSVGTAAFGTINNVNVRFDTAPTLTGGGGAAGTSTYGIVVGAFNNQVIATYDSTNGLRALNTTTEMATLTSGWATTTANAKLANGAGPLDINANTTVNSLQLGLTTGSGATTSGANKITVTSGMIAVGQGSTLGNAEIAFGGAEGIIHVANTRSLVVNSAISGSAGLTVALENATAASAFLVLNGANTYTGTTRFLSNGAGNVRLTNSLALQNTTLEYNNYGSGFTFGNGTTTGQTAYTFGGLTGSQAINLNNNNTTVAAVALTLGSAGSADTSSTVNTYSGVLSNTVAGGSIIKAGVATQALSGINTYSGGTQVNGGQLLANTAVSGTNSATGTGAITVGINGTLGGIGQIAPGSANGITVDGVIAPGASIGKLTINLSATTGGVTMNSGSTFTFELGTASLTLAGAAGLGTTDNDVLALTGTTAGDFVFNSNTVTLSGASNGFYKLFDTDLANATLAGDAWQNLTYDLTTGLVSGGLVAGANEFYVGTSANGGALGDIYLNVVPEPSTWSAILGGMGILIGAQSLRRRRGI